MSRLVPIALALLLGGCATNSGDYYYSGSGDYYYGAGTADFIVDGGPYYSGYLGYGGGYGYGGLYSPWFYGYWPIWWSADQPQFDSDVLRHARVEQDRVQRRVLVERPTVRAPESSRWSRPGSPTLPSLSRGEASTNAGPRPYIAPSTGSVSASPTATRAMGNVPSPSRPSQRSMQMPAPTSAPMRAAPAPVSRSGPSRRQ